MDIQPVSDPRLDLDGLAAVLEAIASGSETVGADTEPEKGQADGVDFEERIAPILVTVGAILLIALAHAFGWFGRVSDVIAPPLVEQNMRVMLALAVQEIEQSQERTGVYPQRLAVSEIPGDDSWRYELVAPARYRLSLVLRGVEVSFDSKVDVAPVVAQIGNWSQGKQ